MLIALCMPATISFKIVASAAFFAIAIAKHPFGGLGNNLFNPASQKHLSKVIGGHPAHLEYKGRVLVEAQADFLRNPLCFAGSITMGFRYFGGFEESMPFAVLLANAFVPLIDRYNERRQHAHKGWTAPY